MSQIPSPEVYSPRLSQWLLPPPRPDCPGDGLSPGERKIVLLYVDDDKDAAKGFDRLGKDVAAACEELASERTNKRRRVSQDGCYLLPARAYCPPPLEMRATTSNNNEEPNDDGAESRRCSSQYSAELPQSPTPEQTPAWLERRESVDSGIFTDESCPSSPRSEQSTPSSRQIAYIPPRSSSKRSALYPSALVPHLRRPTELTAAPTLSTVDDEGYVEGDFFDSDWARYYLEGGEFTMPSADTVDLDLLVRAHWGQVGVYRSAVLSDPHSVSAEFAHNVDNGLPGWV